MPNVRLTPINLVDSATISAASVASGVSISTTDPATNLQNDLRKSVMKGVDGNGIYIYLTWPTPQTGATMLGTGRINATTFGTVQAAFYTDSAWTTLLSLGSLYSTFIPTGMSTIDDTASDDFRLLKNSDFYFTSPGTFQSVRIQLQDSGMQIIELSRLFLGKYKEIAVNPFFGGGLSVSVEDMSKQARSYGASLITDKREKFLKLPINLDWVRDANDRADLMAIARYCGLDKSLWVSTFPAVNDYMDVYTRGPMKFTSMPAMTPTLPLYSRSQLMLEGL